jgi:hypothetical protein
MAKKLGHEDRSCIQRGRPMHYFGLILRETDHCVSYRDRQGADNTQIVLCKRAMPIVPRSSKDEISVWVLGVMQNGLAESPA